MYKTFVLHLQKLAQRGDSCASFCRSEAHVHVCVFASAMHSMNEQLQPFQLAFLVHFPVRMDQECVAEDS